MTSFGRAMLEHWMLDPAIAYLNHGTVGATPRRVLARQQALRDEMERQPSRFMLRELNGHQPMPWRERSRLREASDRVAPFVGCRADDLVFVPNVTSGLNAVLASFPFSSGDEIVMTDLAYGAIAYSAAFWAQRSGASVRTVNIAYPVRQPAEIVRAIDAALNSRTRLVVIDHITAHTALILPVAAVAEACHARGIAVAVDGAHVPGAHPLDIASLGVDWYSANLHKWAHAPRGCGILWAARERQEQLRPTVVSWGHGKGFRTEFEHTATSDPTSYLAAPEGIALLEEWGFAACVGYMHALACEAARVLTACWGTNFDVPEEMIGSMVTVPLPSSFGATDEDAAALRLALLVEDQIEVQLHGWRGRLWVRVSAQVYNDRSDVERLADAIARRTRPSLSPRSRALP
jgi:isopenicillin-N epimerase